MLKYHRWAWLEFLDLFPRYPNGLVGRVLYKNALTSLKHLQCVSKPNRGGMMVRFIHWSIRTIQNLSLVRILQLVRTDSNRKIERQAESMHGGLMPVAELTILNFLI